MILELTGLPGSGKSTCAKVLTEKLTEHGCNVLSLQWDLVRRYARDHIYGRYGFAHELRRFKLMRGIVSVMFAAHVDCNHWHTRYMTGSLIGPWDTSSRKRTCNLTEIMLLFDYYLDEVLPHASANTICMSSEGLVHSTVSMKVFSAERQAEILGSKWLERCLGSKLTVVDVKTSKEECLERVWRCGVPHKWPRKSRRDKGLVREILLRFDENIKLTLDEYRRMGVRVLSLENNGDIIDLKAAVGKFVVSFFSQ